MTQPTPAEVEPPKRLKFHFASPIKRVSPWFFVAVLLLVSMFLFTQYQTAKHKLSTPQTSKASPATNDLLAKVSRITVLPVGQTPTIATVTSASKLRNQTFFAHAKDGDKVIVYNQAKEAILYRPSTNQIVTIAPVNVTANNNPADN